MKDELLEEAKEWSRKQGYVSVSYIQRIMRIGYVRSARLVDLMIEDKFCGEYIPGTSHREIIEAVEHRVQSDGAVCTCKVDPSVNRLNGMCLQCGKPRR